MSLWITCPVVVRWPSNSFGRDAKFDFYLTNVCEAFGLAPPNYTGVADFVDNEHPEAETFGSAALRLAWLSLKDQAPPAILFDCRNMPTIGSAAASYKLLKKAGWARTTPYALGWAEGTEVVQAIRLYQRLKTENLAAVAATNWPNGRVRADCSMSTVAAACALGHGLPPATDRFEVLATGYARRPAQRSTAIEDATAEALAGCGGTQPRWISGPDSAVRALTARHPGIEVVKDNQSAVNGGSVAPLIRLATPMEANEPGIVVVGESDVVGVLVVIRKEG